MSGSYVRCRGLAAVVLALAASGCGWSAAGEVCCDGAIEAPLVQRVAQPVGALEARGERDGFAVRWRPDPDPVPVNEPFRMRLELELFDAAGGPAQVDPDDVEVYVHAWMPDHRHGMLRQPFATHRGDGSYDVRGALLHMGGFWQVFVDVVRAGELERATFELTL